MHRFGYLSLPRARNLSRALGARVEQSFSWRALFRCVATSVGPVLALRQAVVTARCPT